MCQRKRWDGILLLGISSLWWTLSPSSPHNKPFSSSSSFIIIFYCNAIVAKLIAYFLSNSLAPSPVQATQALSLSLPLRLTAHCRSPPPPTHTNTHPHTLTHTHTQQAGTGLTREKRGRRREGKRKTEEQKQGQACRGGAEAIRCKCNIMQWLGVVGVVEGWGHCRWDTARTSKRRKLLTEGPIGWPWWI